MLAATACSGTDEQPPEAPPQDADEADSEQDEADSGPAAPSVEQAADVLRAASSAANYAYGILLKSGSSNFAGTRLSSDRTINGAISPYDGKASEAAIETLTLQDPDLVFQTKTDYGSIANKAEDIVSSRTPKKAIVWVQVNGTTIESGDSEIVIISSSPSEPNAVIAPNTAVIRSGDLIRLGVVTASGSSLCLIIVADSLGGYVSGDGWQFADAASTRAGHGADCGSEAISSNGASSPHEYKEMPRTAGTNSSLMLATDGRIVGEPPSATREATESERAIIVPELENASIGIAAEYRHPDLCRRAGHVWGDGTGSTAYASGEHTASASGWTTWDGEYTGKIVSSAAAALPAGAATTGCFAKAS